MSLHRAEQKENQIREAILDLLAYFAVWGIKLDFGTLYQYLQVNTSNIAVKKQLETLVKRGKIKRSEDLYGLANHRYPNQTKQKLLQGQLLKKARRWGRVFGLAPFVKSVVVINSVAYGNPHAKSDIDLFVITTPNRIFVAKAMLMYGLKLLKQLETQDQPTARFSLGMFLTTHGAKLQKDMMKVNHPDLPYRMITGVPVYGSDTWYSVLRKDPYLAQTLPNYVWPKAKLNIYGAGFSVVDRLDNLGYRRHLRHTATQPKSHTDIAFIRVRPDIINLHHKGTTAQIADKWKEIRNKL